MIGFAPARGDLAAGDAEDVDPGVLHGVAGGRNAQPLTLLGRGRRVPADDQIAFCDRLIGPDREVREGRQERTESLGELGATNGVAADAPVMQLIVSQQIRNRRFATSGPDLRPIPLHQRLVFFGRRRWARVWRRVLGSRIPELGECPGEDDPARHCLSDTAPDPSCAQYAHQRIDHVSTHPSFPPSLVQPTTFPDDALVREEDEIIAPPVNGCGVLRCLAQERQELVESMRQPGRWRGLDVRSGVERFVSGWRMGPVDGEHHQSLDVVDERQMEIAVIVLVQAVIGLSRGLY
jgi:hypothetical protein